MPLTTRLEPPLPADALVLRGGMMLARDLALAAERCEAQFGFPGVSVFGAAGVSFREILLAAPALRTYRVVRQTRASAVRIWAVNSWPPEHHLISPCACQPLTSRLSPSSETRSDRRSPTHLPGSLEIKEKCHG